MSTTAAPAPPSGPQQVSGRCRSVRRTSCPVLPGPVAVEIGGDGTPRPGAAAHAPDRSPTPRRVAE
ncbi:hypothetical protein [Streptomyces sp. NPDC059224]|uniref:hypothetical protein n=1 Tax=Streptomyces sp. NPDC059224 TaxID=3346775 RepID=UPI00367B383B